MAPDVCFIVPSYRSRTTIRATIDSIFGQRTERQFDVLVVDSSADDTTEWLKKLHPEVRTLKSETRLFPGAARNRGVRETAAPLLAFLDADATLAPDWLESLLARLAVSPDLSLVGGAVVNANPESLPSRLLHWIEFSEYLPGLPSGFRAALSSSNLLVKRDEFLAKGGFDESYGMAEDLLLCRKWRQGLFFEGKARIFHRHRCTWKEVSEHLQALGYWSGRYRASHPTTSGSWLRRIPLASFGLPFLRAPRILARLLRSNWKEGAKATLLLPLLLWALFRWTTGFYNGLRVAPQALT
ncbi:MAG: glycosyltransferase [Acidobacteria bacterium]|nr:MAG: glycosyltransferase [Acidobacteriota bacterium]